MAGPRIALIAAVGRDGGIGRGNALLWHVSEDLRRFRRTTMGCPILMGRRTWDSIGRPLPGRRNIVVTRDRTWTAEGAESAPSLAEALDRLRNEPRVFVIGGAQLYAEALPLADELLLTEVDAVAPADTYFPDWDRSAFEAEAEPWRDAAEGSPSPAPRYRFVTYRRRRVPAPAG